jgi:hypothetical protein
LLKQVPSHIPAQNFNTLSAFSSLRQVVAKQNVVFQNFPGYSLHFALSTVGSYMHVKITKAQCFNH